MTRGGGDRDEKDNPVREVVINMRLSGTLEGFLELIAELYRSDLLFKVDSFVLRPFKGTEMKILLDITGFYRLAGENQAG